MTKLAVSVLAFQ